MRWLIVAVVMVAPAATAGQCSLVPLNMVGARSRLPDGALPDWSKGICVQKGAQVLACVQYMGLDRQSVWGDLLIRFQLRDKATGKWTNEEVGLRGDAKEPGTTLIPLLIDDELPVMFNGVATGREANPCAARGWFGRRTRFVFRMAGKSTEVDSGDTAIVLRLLTSGASMEPW